MKSELNDVLISMLVDGNEIVSLFCTYMDVFIYTEFDECERHFNRSILLQMCSFVLDVFFDINSRYFMCICSKSTD